MTQVDREYYLSRAVEEDRAAARASCAAARECHKQLAALYRARCSLAPGALVHESNRAKDPPFAKPISVLAA